MRSFTVDNTIDTETKILLLGLFALALLWAIWFIYIVFYGRPDVPPPDFSLAPGVVSFLY